MSEPKYVAETLAWCNRLRKKHGKKPLEEMPQGIPMDPASCPCGRATGFFVELRGAYTSPGYSTARDDPNFRANASVRAFIAAFDDGRLPQYQVQS